MMEKHKCKLCFRNFSNGRALGGHMRSHMMNPKANESSTPPPPIQLSFEAESSPSPSSSSFEEEEDNKGLSYGLRENPKKSFRFADPEFADTGSVILQDRESETESSKNPTRRRSKRTWRLSALDHHQTPKKIKFSISNCYKNESASSASDTTTEEDVAFCLMMLSRDKWKRIPYNNKEQEQQELLEDKYEKQPQEEEEYDDENEDEDEDDDEEEDESEGYEEINKSSKTTTTTRVRGRYKCETCNKVFKSYQALGGHRASHKKIKFDHCESELEHNNGGAASPSLPEKKIHECPVCFRVFASGQALGGHKRTHVIGSTPTTTPTSATAIATTRIRSSTNLEGESLIDLNLPAPVDYDDFSQIEDSAVSDAEFVKPH